MFIVSHDKVDDEILLMLANVGRFEWLDFPSIRMAVDKSNPYQPVSSATAVLYARVFYVKPFISLFQL